MNAVVLLLPLLLGSGPAAQGPTGPAVRIGLGDPVSSIRISARQAWSLHLEPEGVAWSLAPGEAVLCEAQDTAAPEAAEPLYRILFASTPVESDARRLAGWVEARSGLPCRVFWNRERGSWRAFAGAFPNRSTAGRAVPILARLGLQALWVTERTSEESEPGSRDEGFRVRREGSPETVWTEGSARAWTSDPEGGVLLRHGPGSAATYRGALEVHRAPGGGLQLVNELGLESYLRGVVPREMGPAQFPRLEALKAQAVAARTYIAANRGAFRHRGYDLCDSQRCQVYGGAAAEHPLSDRAVRETRGLVLVHEGQPIRAYYTARCGGHTEAVGEVFVEERADYLPGVPCPAEAPQGPVVRRAEPVAVIQVPDMDPRPVNFLLAWLRARHGAPAALLRPDEAYRRADAPWREAFREGLRLPLAPGEALAATDRLIGIPDGSLRTRAAWAALVARSLRAREGSTVGEVQEVLPRGLRWRTAGGGGVLRFEGTELLFLRDPSGDPGGDPVPAAALSLRRGDRVEWVESRHEGAPGLLVLEADAAELARRLFPPPAGWEDAKSREDLARRLAPRVGVTRPKALHPLRIGNSGRVSRLLVEADSASVLALGIRVRWSLGLRESLFLPAGHSRAVPAEGRLEFHGAGWGHGVGLCQRGAFGLAGRGWDHKRILVHYYPGAELSTGLLGDGPGW